MRFKNLLVPPKSKRSEVGAGLRFTDILFGFVIRELFVRMQHWPDLEDVVRAQLVVATILVLGSWIGFRQSVNRSDYELKFFNLPLFRFLLDQAMVFLYFRIATLTPENGGSADLDHVTHDTAKIIFAIFALYWIWDLFGLWMLKAKNEDKKRKYPREGESDAPVALTLSDMAGVAITSTCLILSGGLYFIAIDGTAWNESHAMKALVATAFILLLYRWLKDVRTTHKDLASA